MVNIAMKKLINWLVKRKLKQFFLSVENDPKRSLQDSYIDFFVMNRFRRFLF